MSHEGIPPAESTPGEAPLPAEELLKALHMAQNFELAASVYGLPPALGLENPNAILDAIRANPLPLLIAHGQQYRSARIDRMTQLPNRQAFEEQFAELSAEKLAAKQILGVVLVDLDNFKKINDRLSYADGDQLLRAVAEKLRDTDNVFRLGGDEFVVVPDDDESRGGLRLPLEELAKLTEYQKRQMRLEIVGNRIGSVIRETFVGIYEDRGLDVSLGLALTEDGDEPNDVLKRANDALKIAKRNNQKEARKQAAPMVRVYRAIGRTGYRLSGDFDDRTMP